MGGPPFLHTVRLTQLPPVWVQRPGLLLFFVLLEAVYLSGWVSLWRAGFRQLATPGALLRQWIGFTMLAFALTSVMETWQRFSLAAHMLQHELLFLASPLLLSARPMAIGFQGLPREVRARVGATLRPGRPLRVLLDIALRPWTALGVSMIILWSWHLPVLYNAVEYSRLLHDVQHIGFFTSGLLLWWPIVRAAPYRYRWSQVEGVLYGLVAYVLVAMTLRSLLGAYFTLTDQPVYEYYVGVLGPEALEDQRLAGAVMWFLPLPILVAAALSAVWGKRPVPSVRQLRGGVRGRCG